MLSFTEHPSRPSLAMVVEHDDAAREYAYTAGAEDALQRAKTRGWSVVSMKDDWNGMFVEMPARR